MASGSRAPKALGVAGAAVFATVLAPVDGPCATSPVVPSAAGGGGTGGGVRSSLLPADCRLQDTTSSVSATAVACRNPRGLPKVILPPSIPGILRRVQLDFARLIEESNCRTPPSCADFPRSVGIMDSSTRGVERHITASGDRAPTFASGSHDQTGPAAVITRLTAVS